MQADAAFEPQLPTLAPSVELVGELPGSGFRDRQWLIVREGRFVQLSELLYRVAENADGTRTLEEIAAAITEETESAVTSDHVRALVAKLIPLGILLDARGVSSSRASGRSLLQVGMRTKALGPRVLDPVTGVLRWLFAPALLLPLLAAVVAAHVWLYTAHSDSVAAGLFAVLYSPALVIPLFAVIVLTGFVHEFGHASALHYGGGRARTMGAGFYLIYPVLYTDTSDAYRLGRWARVRVDLGGFYFHLIAATALIAIAFSASAEWLLVAVLTINLELARQLLFPVVRFDGYWLLADVTGIPDPFTALVPFLRSAFGRGKGWKGARLPALRRWVKVVFATYIALTIPALTALLYLFVTRAPRFVSAAWDSITTLADDFSRELGRGDFVDAMVAAGQLAILALPVVGGAYVTFTLVRMIVGTVERARQPAAAPVPPA